VTIVVVVDARSDWVSFVADIGGVSVSDVVVGDVVVTAGAFAHPIRATPMISDDRRG
jgi:hypothetical protein